MPDPDLFTIPGFSDPFSSITHLLGAAVFALLTAPLILRGARAAERDAESHARKIALAIFAASAVFLLSMSGVFHLLQPHGAARAVLQRLDHAGIFLLIAGTFTPIHVIMFKGPWRWGMLTFIWTLAAVGVTLKSIFFDSTPMALGLALYVGMGWIGLASLIVLTKRFGIRLALPLLLGGLSYTVGAAIEGANPPNLVPGVVRAHEIFHIAVLLGLALHWRFIWSVADFSTGRGHSDVMAAARPAST